MRTLWSAALCLDPGAAEHGHRTRLVAGRRAGVRRFRFPFEVRFRLNIDSPAPCAMFLTV